MALNGVLRPGFVQIRVLDMEQALVHYRDRIGLNQVGAEPDGRVYLRGYDEFDRHSIILRQAESSGMDVMGFRVLDDETLTLCGERLTASGAAVEDIAAGEQPGIGRRLRFASPTGHVFDLFAEMERAPRGPMTSNPDLWHDEPHGMRAKRFDHCLLYGDEIEATVKLFQDALDFRLSECILLPDSKYLAAFLTCSQKSHDIAFVRHTEKGKFHHCSFLVEDWNEIGHAADLMTRYDIAIDIGPTRHGITRGKTIYFFDPSGNRNEVFAGAYDHYPDYPTRVWQADQAGKAIFYYERALNDRFLSVVT